jgi:hypothetical protein
VSPDVVYLAAVVFAGYVALVVLVLLQGSRLRRLERHAHTHPADQERPVEAPERPQEPLEGPPGSTENPHAHAQELTEAYRGSDDQPPPLSWEEVQGLTPASPGVRTLAATYAPPTDGATRIDGRPPPPPPTRPVRLADIQAAAAETPAQAARRADWEDQITQIRHRSEERNQIRAARHRTDDDEETP